MILPADDAEAFFTLVSHLDAYVSRRAKVVPGLDAADQIRGATVAQLGQIRKILWSDRSLIDAFVAENPDRLDPAELDEIRAFGLAVAGRFTIERDLPDHTIFHAEDGRVYGVVGLSEPVVDIVGRSGIALPVLVTTALLPFRGRIVWDGLPAVSLVLLGPNQRRSLAEAYTHARKRGAILVSLEPEAPRPLPIRTAAGAPTVKQAEYLDFIREFTSVHGVPPSFAEIQGFFGVTPPTVNSMIKTLEARGFLARVPGAARTLRVLAPGGDGGKRRTQGVDEPLRVASLVIERLVPALRGQALLYDAVAAVLDAADVACAGASERDRERVQEELRRVASIAMNLGDPSPWRRWR